MLSNRIELNEKRDLNDLRDQFTWGINNNNMNKMYRITGNA